jgi:hypothetical protein
MKLCKIGLAVCGIALGLYSAYGAFRFNVGISGDYAFASVLVALTVGCWFLPPVAAFLVGGKKTVGTGCGVRLGGDDVDRPGKRHGFHCRESA